MARADSPPRPERGSARSLWRPGRRTGSLPRLGLRASLVLVCLAAFPALAASPTLERIRSSGAIVMGYIEDGVPFSSLGADGNPKGYAVDLCREIAVGVATQLGLPRLETRWVALTVQDRLDAVYSGRVDIECSTTTWTLTRQAAVDFSLITFVDGGNILVRDSASPTRLADFAGKRVAVIRGTTTEQALRAGLAQRGIDAEILTVESRGEGLQLLDAFKVDGFASDRTPLIGIVGSSAMRSSFRLLDEDFSVEQYAFALARGDHEFRLAVNRVLARLYRSGDIIRIYNQSLGALGPPSLLLSATYFIQSLAE